MKEYRLIVRDGMACGYLVTKDLNRMKDEVIKILKQQYLNEKYAAMGIRKRQLDDRYWEGATIEVWENGEIVNEIDYYNAFELTEEAIIDE